MAVKSKKHLERVAALPCCVTGKYSVQVHHLKLSPITGTSQKASDFFTMPLSPEIHDQFHDLGRRTWEMAYGSQISHIEDTLKRLYG